jgi:hypothetical protein
MKEVKEKEMSTEKEARYNLHDKLDKTYGKGTRKLSEVETISGSLVSI